MTLYQFNRMSAEDQRNLVFLKGIHVGGRLEGEYTVLLYQLDAFYVELYFTPYHTVDHLYSFADPDELEIYLQQIRLPEFL